MAPVDTTQVGKEQAAKLGMVEEPAPATEQEQTPSVEEGEESQQTEAEEAEPGEGETEEAPKTTRSQTVPLQRFNEVYGRMKELERALTDVARGVVKQPRPQAQPAPPPPDLDSFTNTELANYVLQNLRGDMRQIIQETVGPVASSVEMSRVSSDIQQTSAKYPDFWDYRDKMIEISNRHPTLTAEETYLLASGNPASAKKAVMNRVKQQMATKKAARTEMRSSPSEKTVENKEFKTVKEAGLSVAKKLGMM